MMKQLLHMIEEGKLTAEEARILIEESDKRRMLVFRFVEEKRFSAVDGDALLNLFAAEPTPTATCSPNAQNIKNTLDTATQVTSEKLSGLFDFLDSAVKKIKDVDFDFNFGSSFTVNKTIDLGEHNFDSLDINIANGDVKIVSWDQNDIRAEVEAKVYREQTEEEAEKVLSQEISFDVKDDRLRFFSQRKSIKLNVVLYVPKASCDKARINLFNGDIVLEKLEIERMYASTVNGVVYLDEFKGEEASLETKNGSIRVTASDLEELKTETINGAVEIAGKFEKVDAHCVNGNVKISLTNNDAESIFAKTVAGSIHIHVPTDTTLEGEFRAKLGSVSVQHPNVKILSEKQEAIQKWARFATSEKEALFSALNIQADTKTGSIYLLETKE